MMRLAPCVTLLFVLFTLAATACSDASDKAAPAAPTGPAPAATCAADERATSAGTCELFAPPASSCAPGTRPAVGADACVAVGPTSCAAGFQRDATGWGCAPVLPAAACVGATRPNLGETACKPVGDCAATFPPAGAILVDPTFDAAALDATHVRTVADALKVAVGGATIALADGTHSTDPFTVSKPLTFVGRCAERARLVAAQPAATSGIAIGADTTLRGMTIEGFTATLSISGAVTLDAADIVIEGARSRAVLAERGAKVTMRRSVVRGTTPIGKSDQTIAVLVGTSASVDLEDCAILANLDGALAVTDNVKTRATLTRCVVQDTKPRADAKTGAALRAFQGATLGITDSAILGSAAVAILAFRHEPAPPPQVSLARSVVAGTVSTTQTGNAIGTAINAAHDAIVNVDESTIADTEGTALYVADKAKLTFKKSVVLRVKHTPDLFSQGGTALKDGTLALEDSAVVGVGGVGLGGWSSGRVTMSRSLVRDVGGDVAQMLTLGNGLSALEGAIVEATDSAIVDAREVGVSASKAGSTVKLQGVLITRTDDAPAPRFGHGILAVDRASITLTRGIVERQVGVGLFFASAGGIASGSLVRVNAVGVHAQDGSTIAEADAAPDAPPAEEIVVTKDTRFVDNATRVGSGVLPLPAPIAPPPAAQ